MNVLAALESSPIRRRIMDVLTGLPTAPDETGCIPRETGLTAGELAAVLGRHSTSVRVQLDQLIEAGLVQASNQVHGVGRPRRLYSVAFESIPEGVNGESAFQQMRDALASVKDDALSPEEAGRLWVLSRVEQVLGRDLDSAPARTLGQWLGKVGMIMDLFEKWGYVPEMSTSEQGRLATLCLAKCPLRDLAEHDLATACRMHAGMIEGVVEVLGEAEVELDLVPFAEPHVCHATLSHRGLGQPRGPVDVQIATSSMDPSIDPTVSPETREPRKALA